jgi:transposase
MCREHESVVVVCPPVSRVVDREEVAVRYVGLDVHREFCEVAIAEQGRVRSAGRVRTRRAELELFAQSLGSDDEVALESTGGAVAIRILEPHVARVVVVNTKKLRQISEAKAKTDRLDARRLAELLAAGYLAEVWCPDEQTRALRRLVARRAQLVRQRSRAKNEIAAALQRNLLDRPGVYDVAGERGRRFLAGVELPDDERQTVEGCLRQIDFLDEEIAAVNRVLAEAAVGSHQMRRLMSVPGVDLQTAATFVACVGDIGRFRDPRRLVSYLGLDPRVR